MNQTRFLALLTAALLLTAFPAAAGKFMPAPKGGVPDTYLVLLEEGVATKAETRGLAQSLARLHGGELSDVWQYAVQGFLVRMPEARARRLAEDPRVALVEQDYSVPFSAAAGDCYQQDPKRTPWPDPRPLPSPTASPQPINCANPDPASDTGSGDPLCQDNWGLDRTDQTHNDGQFYFSRNGTDVHVYVLDSGILATHDQFKDTSVPAQSRVTGGANVQSSPTQCGTPTNTNDTYGHGTHVAAIIGGRTYGVAKNVKLHPVKAFGGATIQDQISQRVRGLDWIIADVQGLSGCTAGVKRPAVVNWSGGNDTRFVEDQLLRNAVSNLIGAGIILVQASGNQQGAIFPGDTPVDAGDYTFGDLSPDVIVAGGIDHNRERWATLYNGGANFGSAVDLWAPAGWVLSASYTGPTAACELSGTSMAAPHVTGAVAAYLQHNQNATGREVARALRGNGTWGVLSEGSTGNTIGPDTDNVILRLDTIAPPSNLAPVAEFTVTCTGRKCTFTSSSSDDVTEHAWKFGDGATSTAVNPTHVYAAGFSGYAVLEVKDSQWQTDHVRKKLPAIVDTAPTASFTATCEGLTCTFTSTSTDDAGITSTQWNLGDGTTRSGTPVTHTYAAGGTYTVTLTVTDTINQTGTKSESVPVGLTPPTGVTAYASGTTVTITWTPVAGADGYDIYLKSSSAPYGFRKNVAGGSSSQTTDSAPPSANGVVLYHVVARAGAGGSAPSLPDVAWVGTFTDPIITTQATIVKSAHLTEMRAAVNGLRQLAGAGDTYTAAEVAPTALQNQTIEDEHWTSLMTNLSNARQAVLPSGWSWTNNSAPAGGAVIAAAHLNDLRNAVK